MATSPQQYKDALKKILGGSELRVKASNAEEAKLLAKQMTIDRLAGCRPRDQRQEFAHIGTDLRIARGRAENQRRDAFQILRGRLRGSFQHDLGALHSVRAFGNRFGHFACAPGIGVVDDQHFR